MSDRLRFGILSTGNIARQFAQGVVGAERSTITAVGSRSADTAQHFARQFDIPAAHASYEDLLADPTVDAVYNALPNAMHHDWTLRALQAGKHVLCEKPFANNLAQSRAMFDAARAADRLLVEAYMYQSHPLTHAVTQALAGGEIGQLRLIRLAFNLCTTTIDENIRFNRDLAGGSLMDIGCYCVSFARLFADCEPASVHATAHLHASGVDDMLAGTLTFPTGVLASFTCGMRAHSINSTYLCGTEGYIEIPIPWKPPVTDAEYIVGRMTPPRQEINKVPGAKREVRTVDAGKPLYALEADDFAAAVLDGAPPAVSEQHTLGNMAVLDEMRRQIGLRFDGESD